MASKRVYFGIAIGLLFIEIFIALHVRDSFIRPYFGDFLATVLLYSSIRTFSRYSVHKSLIISLLISYAVEFFQALNGLQNLGWQANEFVSTLAGSTFDWGDMIAYTIGIITVYLFEFKINHLKN